ncbi:unnamed protein product, partial [Onchocerca flexuosa]|uniref:Uncharacterized protein n=1 Tax=Onchocerca flexuosa TaxID=387005 RepID=A0A183I4D5_9BILA
MTWGSCSGRDTMSDRSRGGGRSKRHRNYRNTNISQNF